MAYRPSSKRKAVPASPQINVTPVMNLMVVLIPMLLAVAQYVQVSLLDYQPPPEEVFSDSGAVAEKRLDLVINVLPNGYEVSLFGETSGENYRFFARQGERYDLEGLSLYLRDIRSRLVGAPLDTVIEIDQVSGTPYRRPVWKYSDAEVVSIAAQGGTPLQEVVRVMDASRSYKDETGVLHTLFPIPRLGQIQ